MLAHGTQVCQWQTIIGFLFLGGLWVHFQVVDSSKMQPNGMPMLSNAGANFSEVYGPGTMLLGYSWMVPRSACGGQEYYPMVYPFAEGNPSMVHADIEVTTTHIMDQVQPLGQFCLMDISFEHCYQRSERQEYQRQIPATSDIRFFWLGFVLGNVLYAKWRMEHTCCLISKSSNWVAYGTRRTGGLHSSSSAGILFWFLLLAFCSPALAVTCRSCLDGIDGCAGGAACLFATRTAENLAALAVAGGAAINVVSLLPASYVRHLPTQVLRTLAAIARVPVADGPPDLGAMTLTELQECLASGRVDLTAYKAELSTRLADPATAAAQVTRISAMLLGVQNNTVLVNTRTIDGINSYGVLGYLVAVNGLML